MKPILIFILIIMISNNGFREYNGNSDIPEIYESIIIDHTCTNLSKINNDWIVNAKNKLHIVYEHTSHGSQIIDGMTGLSNWKGRIFEWNNGGTGGSLDIHDQGITS